MPGLFSPSKQTSTSSSTEEGTSTTTGVRTGKQRKVFRDILDQLLATLSHGTEVTPEERAGMRSSVNQTYGAIAPNLAVNLTSRGLGGSLKPASSTVTPTYGFKGIDTARANQIQSSEATLQDQAQRRFQQYLGLAAPYTKPDTYTTNASSQTNATQTQPGPSIFDKILGYAGEAAGIAALFGV